MDENNSQTFMEDNVLKWEEAEHDIQTRLLDKMLYVTCQFSYKH